MFDHWSQELVIVEALQALDFLLLQIELWMVKYQIKAFLHCGEMHTSACAESELVPIIKNRLHNPDSVILILLVSLYYLKGSPINKIDDSQERPDQQAIILEPLHATWFLRNTQTPN